MQGTVVKVLVKPGDVVEAGQAVCVLEAMKMENNIVCLFAGQVTEVRVEAGDPVGTGDVIVVLGRRERQPARADVAQRSRAREFGYVGERDRAPGGVAGTPANPIPVETDVKRPRRVR